MYLLQDFNFARANMLIKHHRAAKDYIVFLEKLSKTNIAYQTDQAAGKASSAGRLVIRTQH